MGKIISKDKPINTILIVIGLIWILFQVIVARWMFLAPARMIVMHGGFALVLVYLNSMKKNPKKYWPWYLLMMALSITCISYIVINYHDLIATKANLTTMEVVIGVILFIVIF